MYQSVFDGCPGSQRINQEDFVLEGCQEVVTRARQYNALSFAVLAFAVDDMNDLDKVIVSASP
jgi:hypothetical protein